MKLRLLASIVSLSATAIAFAGACISANAASTLAPGVLSVGSDETLPPYTYLEHATPASFDQKFTGKAG
ncbi:polar amino acid transport system substrate-binding protein [Paraburkholderia fungorum]|uniref:Polar amino acid transport system substrate-binding protein n=1 Tax=Paraburkholderia fungorum TaxID=134537 RepID=A0A1H1I436_9BURK|nr:hypothetical protein [Paraburkholderia fungorum]SDR32464.1 polar amino acid transport system substrate-binding protein [Paraburkholderia fungorum]